MDSTVAKSLSTHLICKGAHQSGALVKFLRKSLEILNIFISISQNKYNALEKHKIRKNSIRGLNNEKPYSLYL